ncbi:MAG: hypothetical protein JWM31_223 [Solirubrobacterales bacterium]|nr:hypothetical protein [Solirubrobacterales bacterium]
MATFLTVCTECGRQFEAHSSLARMCGTACRVRAHRARRAAQHANLLAFRNDVEDLLQRAAAAREAGDEEALAVVARVVVGFLPIG